MEAALHRMMDRCQSAAQASVRASAEELASILGLTDRQTAVTICGLYSKVEEGLCVFVYWASHSVQASDFECPLEFYSNFGVFDRKVFLF